MIENLITLRVMNSQNPCREISELSILVLPKNGSGKKLLLGSNGGPGPKDLLGLGVKSLLTHQASHPIRRIALFLGPQLARHSGPVTAMGAIIKSRARAGQIEALLISEANKTIPRKSRGGRVGLRWHRRLLRVFEGCEKEVFLQVFPYTDTMNQVK